MTSITSTLDHAVSQLKTFGIDIDPENCDTESLRLDVEDIRAGITPPHLDTLPPTFAADLMDMIATILEGPAF